MLISMLVLLANYHAWIAIILFAAMFVQGIVSYRVQQQAFENPVLQAIDFHVKRGERIAIVGENGAGKSTLVKLLLRLYPLERGAICFDDTPVSEMDILSYRKQFAAIFQDFGEFDLSLEENVVMSDLKQEDENRVLMSFAQAGIDLGEWEMKPEQIGREYLTVIILGTVLQIMGTGLVPILRNLGGAAIAQIMVCIIAVIIKRMAADEKS